MKRTIKRGDPRYRRYREINNEAVKRNRHRRIEEHRRCVEELLSLRDAYSDLRLHYENQREFTARIMGELQSVWAASVNVVGDEGLDAVLDMWLKT